MTNFVDRIAAGAQGAVHGEMAGASIGGVITLNSIDFTWKYIENKKYLEKFEISYWKSMRNVVKFYKNIQDIVEMIWRFY